ncbi:MAG: GNAT family N-acetyltransferase [Gammaproteobacteria bacterium]|nr:GNAT family N-acetyltransferase [Gammaproteobacteria bacterium]
MSIILETKRLTLKLPTEADFNDLLSLRTDPEVMQYIGSGNIETEEQIKEFLTKAKHYHEQHGYSLYSVFEKSTNHFVGQAGLFHLGFDVTQSEVEIAYRLNKRDWHKGYATELAKALIQFGFKHFSLSKVVARVHVKNERSRSVLEKAGMSYCGLVDFHNMQVPYYEIYNNKIQFDDLKLIPASISDYSVIQNMGRFYVYDMSEYMGHAKGWEMPQDGLYECISFKKYWETDKAYPFLIHYKNEIAGFVIVDNLGCESATEFNMAQFFILRKFKHQGIGKAVANWCFDRFPGRWEVMVMPGNEGAYRFWRSVISHRTQNNFTESTGKVPHFDNIKNIFYFDTK